MVPVLLGVLAVVITVAGVVAVVVTVVLLPSVSTTSVPELAFDPT